MGRFWTVLVLAAALLLPAGCAADTSKDDFLRVNSYVEALLPAVEGALLDLRGWVRDPLDEERLAWLEEGKDELLAVREKHLGGSFPTTGEMKSWNVPVIREEEHWTIEGRLLGPAVEEATAAADALIDVLTGIGEAGGRLDEAERAEVEQVAGEAEEAVRELAEIFRMERAGG